MVYIEKNHVKNRRKDMVSEPRTYGEWLKQIKDFKGGGLGGLVILITIAVTPVLAYYGIRFFPPGEYPKIVLALPGLVAAFFVFLVTSAILWQFRKPK
jgi:hypothetical protein